MAKPGPRELLEFLKTKKAGDLVSEAQILDAVPSWKKVTLDTYRKKNKLARILAVAPQPGMYRVVSDGDQLTEVEINAALSQVAPRTVVLARNDKLQGTQASYVLVRELGAGAVGAVWEARNSRTGERVAVKVCSPRPDLLEPSVFGNVKDRFKRESRLSPRVDCEAIITYLDHGDHLTTSFLVMELAEGSLRDLLAARGHLSTHETAEVALRVTAALRWLHSINCVHRDVKPPNILMTKRGYVLGDLGIVRWGDLNRGFTGAGTITKAAVQLGSWNYMAPEQIDDAHEASNSSDIYALGITCVEALTGTTPTPHRVAAGQIGAPAGDPDFDSLIHRMTAFEPTGRPSLSEVETVLKAVAVRSAKVCI